MVGELSKLSAFSGRQADFKVWDQELRRVIAVNDLELTLEPLYRPGQPQFDAKHNKILYYLIQRAVEHSVDAHAHFKKAAVFDGNHAYHLLRDAYVYSAQAEGALLLQQLQALRIDPGESLTLFGIRLEELFTNLEGLEGDHAMTFNMTQKLTYLLTAIRREPHLEAAHVYLQAEMNRGTMTFELAMRELHLRSQALRADEALESSGPQPHGSSGRRGYIAAGPPVENTVQEDTTTRPALVTTHNKRHRAPDRTGNRTTPNTNAAHGTPCLVSGCSDLCALPICRLHFASLVCGKATSLPLQDGYGNVTYDKTGKGKAIYPAAVPAELLLPVARSDKRSGRPTEAR